MNQSKPACGPGCNCQGTASRSKTKWIITSMVALAAVGVVTARLVQTSNAATPSSDVYSTGIALLAAPEAVEPAAEDGVWGAPLANLAELNQVATNTEAVFVVLPAKDADRMAVLRKEVTAASATLTARGSVIGKFVLSESSDEYQALAKQVGTPAVLAMYKGRGMSAVADKDVTEANLLKTFVTISRPPSCGPSGCAPSAGCK